MNNDTFTQLILLVTTIGGQMEDQAYRLANVRQVLGNSDDLTPDQRVSIKQAVEGAKEAVMTAMEDC